MNILWLNIRLNIAKLQFRISKYTVKLMSIVWIAVRPLKRHKGSIESQHTAPLKRWPQCQTGRGFSECPCVWWEWVCVYV